MKFAGLLKAIRNKIFEETPPDNKNEQQEENSRSEYNSREDRRRGYSREQEDEPPELTPEQQKELAEKAARRKKLLIICSAAAGSLLLLGIGIALYLHFHLSNSDIELCKFHFKTEDYNSAFKKCKKARKINDPEVHYALGSMYHHQKGLDTAAGKLDDRRRITEALSHYKQSADLKYLPAIQALGNLYLTGARGGIGIDHDQALAWFKLGAEADDYVSMREMVNILNERRDFSTALPWLEKLADYGDSEAAFQLADLYFNGKEVKEDLEKAFYWCEKSAFAGNRNSEHLLSLLEVSLLLHRLDD